jgi:hypothetical protein
MEISPACNYPDVELGGDKRLLQHAKCNSETPKDDCEKMQKNHKSTLKQSMNGKLQACKNYL